MKNTEIIIDLSGFTESAVLVTNFFINQNIVESGNRFGWNVAKAKVQFEAKKNQVISFQLMASDHSVIASAEFKNAEGNEYWVYEYISRGRNSTDPFEATIDNFLDLLISDYGQSELLMNLPVISVELRYDKSVRSIRYALSIQRLYMPLFFIQADRAGFISSVSDYQDKKQAYYLSTWPDSENKQLFLQGKGNNISAPLPFGEPITTILQVQGIRVYPLKFVYSSESKKELSEKGVFLLDLLKILNQPHVILKFIPTINYHITKPCNMKCKHCFSEFHEMTEDWLDVPQAKDIISKIANLKSVRKINFSGGEPTLHPNILEIVQFAKKCGLETSIITNGIKLAGDPKFRDELLRSLDILAISLDSFDSEKNKIIGRVVGSKTMLIADVLTIREACGDNVGFKINTVVTNLNADQDMSREILELKPIRWKILRMLPISGQNDGATPLHPDIDTYNRFVARHREILEPKGIKIVAEDNEDMTGSYLMIGPDGRFFYNTEGEHQQSETIIGQDLFDILCTVPLRREVFYKREGDYSCGN